MQNKKKTILGVMSGTSLDGLDLALCEFDTIEETYSFRIIKANTIGYSQTLKDSLHNIKTASAENYFKFHSEFGAFIGDEINKFLIAHHLKAEAIASHGHTIFHQPQLRFSTQIGCGATIAAKTNLTTICDFRSLDVANSGQGAPLVPIGDKLLFGNYEACLNIGGIANISFDDQNKKRIAYDVCEANMLLNYISEKLGKPYDHGGEIAKLGSVNDDLINQLNHLDYYSQLGAKSIGREWFEHNILKVIEKNSLSPNDLLASSTEHIAHIIATDLNQHQVKSVLITGGGVYNSFLIEKIKSKTKCELIIPNNELVNFKEALIFAFLGYLRLHKKTNTIKSVTGAIKDSIGGAVYINGV